MDQTFVYLAPFATLVDEGAYPSQAFPRAEQSLPDLFLPYIDPSLQSPSPSAPHLSQWDPPQPVQRYLNENQKTVLFNADAFVKINNDHRSVARPTIGIPVVPPPSQARFASPISSIDPSSTSGSVRSPFADTESYHDSFAPTTPPDTSLLPFQQPGHCDHWSPHARAVQFASMGPPAGDAYVNPIDVNPSQDVDCFDADTNGLDFSLTSQRTYSFESYATSQCDLEPTAQSIVVDLTGKRMSSPEDMQPAVEDQIEASFTSARPQDEDAGEDLSEIEVEQYPPKRKRPDHSSEDGDYRPGRKQKSGISGTSSRGQQKKPQPTASRSSQYQTKKKQRAAPAAAPAAQPVKMLPLSSSNSKGAYSCTSCDQSFKEQVNLDAHVKKQHTRPFTCVFHFAGCESTFASKNEWKRHVTSQHLVLNYWLCQEDECAKTTNGPATFASSSRSKSRGKAASAASIPSSAVPVLPNGAIFNRKDLYTQHMRRMHTPPQIKKMMKQAKKSSGGGAGGTGHTTPEWDERLRLLQSRAIQDRCRLPEHMRCPARNCNHEFQGSNAWDQRMEHVARHLERAATGAEPAVVFGGPNDPTLIKWASGSDVAVIVNTAGKWKLNNPLKATPVADAETVVFAPSMPTSASDLETMPADYEHDSIVVESQEDDEYGDFDVDAEGDDDDVV